MHRFLLDERSNFEGTSALLSPALQRHLKAARVSASETFILSDPETGKAFECVLDPATRGRALVQKPVTLVGTGPVEISLALGLTKAETLETAVAGATELGAARICLFSCGRSPPVKARLDRLEKIAAGAAEVAGRKSPPVLEGPISLEELAKTGLGADRKFILWEESGARGRGASLYKLLREGRPAPKVTLVTGPEGGFSEKEVDALVAGGFECCSLGPRILRAATAPAAAIALVQGVWGDLQ
ncbi:MAG: RsmE family RNA methyltransferase [Bdellovibrionota bacterium]